MAMYLANVFFYTNDEGDLARIGYVYADEAPKSELNAAYNRQKAFQDISEIDLTRCDRYTIITFGDSFSEQDSLGYQSRLAARGGSVLNMDRFLSGDNMLQKLIEFLNSDMVSCLQPAYVLYQTVERFANGRSENLDYKASLDVTTLQSSIAQHTKIKPDRSISFFSDLTIKAPVTNLQYFFTDLPTFSKTYKFATSTEGLFARGVDDVLILKEDLDRLPIKNDPDQTEHTVRTLNRVNQLAGEKGIKLIVLIAPDKYDVYQDFIVADRPTPKSTFFKVYDELDKDYLDVAAYRTLRRLVDTEENVYYYDDTHWSPKGAAAVADVIFDLVQRDSRSVGE